MKPPFSPPAHMGKKSKNASDSIDSFLTLMRTLEIVMMNRSDFAKRQLENLEGKLSLCRSEALELSSNCSSFLALSTQKSDSVPGKVEQFISKLNTDLAGEEVLTELAEIMNMAKEEVDNVVRRVYKTRLITIPSNPSRGLCGDFFKVFQLLERCIDCLGEFDCLMDLRLRKISTYLSNLREVTLMTSNVQKKLSLMTSLINLPSTDHNNNETDDS